MTDEQKQKINALIAIHIMELASVKIRRYGAKAKDGCTTARDWFADGEIQDGFAFTPSGNYEPCLTYNRKGEIDNVPDYCSDPIASKELREKLCKGRHIAISIYEDGSVAMEVFAIESHYLPGLTKLGDKVDTDSLELAFALAAIEVIKAKGIEVEL